MNEELKPIIEERLDPELEKRALKRTYNRCGWILLAFAVLSMVISLFIDRFLMLESDAVKAFFSKYVLFVNALVIDLHDTLFGENIIDLMLAPVDADAVSWYDAFYFIAHFFHDAHA